MANGKVGYCGSVRHRMAELCPHGLLASYFCHRFTVMGEQFPMPSSADQQWFHTALWKGSDPRTNISYEQQAKSFKAIFKESDISAKKITHAPRVAGARFLDDHGVDDSVCSESALTLWLYIVAVHCGCASLASQLLLHL
jgi:Centromere DNA-binding protein complex CBF3 subunit, domain 2